MLIIFLFVITVGTVVLGRTMLGRWFNHLSLYSGIWGAALLLVESDLIHYNSISTMAWFYIFSAWLCLFLGSLTTLLLRGRGAQEPTFDDAQLVSRLRLVIWIFSAISFVGIAAQTIGVLREFGGVFNAIFVQGNDLYHARLDHSDIGGISYVGAFAPAACTLAGIYSAKVRKITVTGVLPVLLVVLAGIFAMGRAGMMFAAIWFAVAFLYTPRSHFRLGRRQAIIASGVAVALVVGGITIISLTRGLEVEYSGLSPVMQQASDQIPILPSLIFDYSGPVVGFSDYLAHPDTNVGKFPGMYTFAPIFRFLSRLGLNTDVPPWEESYYTPREINVMTYLKNVHSDFGAIGVLLFPYFLGAGLTWLKLSLEERFEPSRVVLLSQGYLIIMFSFAYNTMFLGVWYFSLILGLAGCYLLKSSILKALLPQLPSPRTA